MKITAVKVFEFEAAHHLPGYDGKCANLHGHSYKLEIAVAALNTILENPTAENICYWIYSELVFCLLKLGAILEKIRLWETSTSYVEIMRD